MPHNRAYYSAPIKQFLSDDPDLILGGLTRNHHFALEDLQRNAWISQIKILQGSLLQLTDAYVFFEFMIPRMGKRVDVVVVYKNIVFVIEFKVGATRYERHFIEQTIDYALDLKCFHEGSHDVLLVPLLLCTAAPKYNNSFTVQDYQLTTCLFSNAATIFKVINESCQMWGNADHIDAVNWSNSRYKPTPTIVQAAQALYAGHDVTDISRNDAGAINLEVTGSAIDKIIEHSKNKNRKTICFVTGVPGAGKTLAGLNIATNRMRTEEDEHAVFLSGNGPLVEVLVEALARDQNEREGIRIGVARQRASTFIQNVHKFRDYYLEAHEVPTEKTVIFDEAQRAWDKHQASKFMRQKRGELDFDKSEPEFLIEVMNRHTDWCVIIALIGGGQEINTGEAGLPEWFSALRTKFTHWDVYFSDKLDSDEYSQAGALSNQIEDLNVTTNSELHLGVSLRSFRAEKLSEFIHYLLANDLAKAKSLYQTINSNYPIVVTRSLDIARSWLRDRGRGSQLYGLIASSGALRLKPYGINVKNRFSASNWFLNGSNDVRSCQYLEDVGTEFDVQGLELDWCGVCWDADLRYVDGEWSYHSFVGTKWNNICKQDAQRYLLNTYRVLLTRARQGMVIYIPKGNIEDRTRPPEFYDPLYNYLSEIGIPCI